MNYFDFFPKSFFPNFELPNSGCDLSASAAYPPVFTVTECFIMLHVIGRDFNLTFA